MQDSILYIALAGLALSLIAVGLLIRLEFKLKKLFAGTKADTLEDVIGALHKELRAQQEAAGQADARIDDLHNRVKRSVQSIRTIRFNPFQDSGSNQSFSMVFADEEGNGVVLSSLYARDRMSVYAKPLEEFSSVHELTDEEQHVIDERKKLHE
ncbi:MAG: DUF4446 family protein [Candidatus Paceibacterota bacterium]|jgi:hypothetical protein